MFHTTLPLNLLPPSRLLQRNNYHYFIYIYCFYYYDDVFQCKYVDVDTGFSTVVVAAVYEFICSVGCCLFRFYTITAAHENIGNGIPAICHSCCNFWRSDFFTYRALSDWHSKQQQQLVAIHMKANQLSDLTNDINFHSRYKLYLLLKAT